MRSVRHYIEGMERSQTVLFPKSIDEYIGEENEVRFIDAFVEDMDLRSLGFSHCDDVETGRPSYDPRDMLKLYIYGYLNHIRTSRMLERECSINIEVIWLMRNLAPDFKTIADFRRDNVERIKGVFRQFTSICNNLDLFGKELIGIDGSKFRAVNNRIRNYNGKTISMNIRRVEERIEKYLREMDELDADEEERNKYLQGRVTKLREKLAEYAGISERMRKTGESEISMTDGDSRAMKHGQGIDVCYNAQIAVDSSNKIIVDYDVTNDAADHNSLARMAMSAKRILRRKKIDVVADVGYHDSVQIRDCIENGITPYVPERKSSVTGISRRIGIPTQQFYPEKFIYDRKRDQYTCPAGQILGFRYWLLKSGRKVGVYMTDSCKSCEFFMRECTINRMGRMFYRWEHEDVMVELRERMKSLKGRRLMAMRKEIVEHPFGTMKRAFNQGYFLLKGLRKVRGEMGLTVLAFNMRRAINIKGVRVLIKAIRDSKQQLKNAMEASPNTCTGPRYICTTW